MSEHEQRDQPDAEAEREPTIADLEVPEADASRVSGGSDVFLKHDLRDITLKTK